MRQQPETVRAGQVWATLSGEEAEVVDVDRCRWRSGFARIRVVDPHDPNGAKRDLAVDLCGNSIAGMTFVRGPTTRETDSELCERRQKEAIADLPRDASKLAWQRVVLSMPEVVAKPYGDPKYLLDFARQVVELYVGAARIPGS